MYLHVIVVNLCVCVSPSPSVCPCVCVYTRMIGERSCACASITRVSPLQVIVRPPKRNIGFGSFRFPLTRPRFNLPIAHSY